MTTVDAWAWCSTRAGGDWAPSATSKSRERNIPGRTPQHTGGSNVRRPVACPGDGPFATCSCAQWKRAADACSMWKGDGQFAPLKAGGACSGHFSDVRLGVQVDKWRGGVERPSRPRSVLQVAPHQPAVSVGYQLLQAREEVQSEAPHPTGAGRCGALVPGLHRPGGVGGDGGRAQAVLRPDVQMTRPERGG